MWTPESANVISAHEAPSIQYGGAISVSIGSADFANIDSFRAVLKQYANSSAGGKQTVADPKRK